MSEQSLVVVFPFMLRGRQHRATEITNVIRKENTVTFALPFSALVSVDSKHEYTVHYGVQSKNKHMSTICIEFKSINDAFDFQSQPVVYISSLLPKKEISLDEELQRVADQLEAAHKSWRRTKGKGCADDEGFKLV